MSSSVASAQYSPVVDKTQQLRAGTVVVPVEQLSEWALDDLKDEAAGVHG
ncbi:hypothetical protein ACH9D2_01265 [Kocuria sp. M4R2S49]